MPFNLLTGGETTFELEDLVLDGFDLRRITEPLTFDIVPQEFTFDY